MRSLLSASPARAAVLAATMCLGVAGNALAAAEPCMRPAEKTAFDLAGLKSELMVIAISCQAQDLYNSFVVRFRRDLVGEERALNGYFSRVAGRYAQKAHDDYITLLANTQSEDGLQQGTLFCDKHLPMFNELTTLKDSKDLDSYAAGRPLVQAIAVVECPLPAKKVKTATK
jgi:hypothetical protein